MVRLARNWREGVLPDPGGLQDQALITVKSIEVVLGIWRKLQDKLHEDLRNKGS